MLGPASSLLILSLALDSFGQGALEPQIYGGNEVDTCGWPSVVYLSSGGGGCTGTLIHPRIVLTAAHCVANDVPSTVRFGESANSAQQLAGTVTCRQGPGWIGATNQGEDYAYCLLESPITSIPIVPVVSACEASAIYQGARIMHVGFGIDENGNSGRKKMLELNINAITPSGEIISGRPNEVICNGDSGGPTFVYLDPAQGGDGTWRVAAIHSWAQGASPTDPNCTNVAGSILVTNAIDWIEQDSGIDITPCGDGDQWSPTAQCGNIPIDPSAMSGGYPNCAPESTVEWAAVCGPGLDATSDDLAPRVAVVTPTVGQTIGEGDTADVEVLAEVADEGWGVASVAMTIRGVGSGSEQTDERNEWQAFSWDLTLPPGSYEVAVTATDHAGNTSEPEVVCFGVGEPGCGEEDDDDTTDSAAGGTTGDGSPDDSDSDPDEDEGSGTDGASGGSANAEEDSGGCRVGSAPSPASWMLLFAGLGAGFLRRRGSASPLR